MGLEQTFERIADALERIASAQEENTKINAWYKTHLCKCDGSCAPDAPPLEELAATETATETVVSDEPAAEAAPSQEYGSMEEALAAAGRVRLHPTPLTALGKDLTFDELKLELAARNRFFKKGTKATTLQREWDLHKNEPLVGSPAPVEQPAAAPQPAPAPAPQQGVPTPRPPAFQQAAPAPAPIDDFGLDLPVTEPEKKPMTKEEAGEYLTKRYNGTDACKKALTAAFIAVGVSNWKEVQEDQAAKVVEIFDAEMAKVENA